MASPIASCTRYHQADCALRIQFALLAWLSHCGVLFAFEVSAQHKSAILIAHRQYGSCISRLFTHALLTPCRCASPLCHSISHPNVHLITRSVGLSRLLEAISSATSTNIHISSADDALLLSFYFQAEAPLRRNVPPCDSEVCALIWRCGLTQSTLHYHPGPAIQIFSK